MQQNFEDNNETRLVVNQELTHSQESQTSQSVSNVPEQSSNTEGATPKKRHGSKKSKKKKDKKSEKSKEKEDNKGDTESKDCEKREKKKKSSKSSRRPEPEGGNSTGHVMSEFDRVIYSDEPLFPDLDLSEDDPKDQYRQRRSNRPTLGLFIPCGQMNSNTMIKFAIIGTELQNVLNISLKRVCF